MRFISLVFIWSILWGASTVVSLPVETSSRLSETRFTPSETGFDTFTELSLPASTQGLSPTSLFENPSQRGPNPGECAIA
ncbi:hypothetical protein C8R47DRAFT_1111637 [Mycena vitilis]|nr:hypothetical protein C8R47DRAFT_1111637 [Mycena vitilis]